MNSSNNFFEKLKKSIIEDLNIENISPILGEVVKVPPDLQISILKGSIILDVKDLLINNSLLKQYNRQFEANGSITEINMNGNIDEKMTTSTMEPSGTGPHIHGIESLVGTTKIKKATGDYKIDGTITLKDELKKGDRVKITPAAGNGSQKWFVDYVVGG